MFELIYDVEFSDERNEYYEIHKDGKPYYRNKALNSILSLRIDRHNKFIKFTNISDKIVNEILPYKHELYNTILSLYDELNIKGYRVICDNSLSNELDYILDTL